MGYKQSKSRNGNSYFDLSYLPSGIYILKVRVGENEKVVKLIILR